MTVAHKTLRAIDEAMKADQGARFRTLLRQTLPLCEDAYSADEDGRRTHLGASKIGDECSRKLWYGFRWAAQKKHEGRLLRLWNRGHLEEGRMIALLLMIGVKFYQFDATGKQFRISDIGGHYGGALDGVAVGVPDLPPNTPCLGEFKTMADKYFVNCRKLGVQDSNPEYFVQMQTYMRRRELKWVLFLVTNKNTDDLHAEIIALNPVVDKNYTQRAADIITSPTEPPRISEQPTWFKCKMCDFHAVCHRNAVPERNCRTCANVQVVDGGWSCRARGEMRDKAQQIAGCDKYIRGF